jgi:hypothetical protein
VPGFTGRAPGLLPGQTKGLPTRGESGRPGCGCPFTILRHFSSDPLQPNATPEEHQGHPGVSLRLPGNPPRYGKGAGDYGGNREGRSVAVASANFVPKGLLSKRNADSICWLTPSSSGDFFMDDSLKKYRAILIEGLPKAQDSVFNTVLTLFGHALLCILLLITSSCGRSDTVTEYTLQKIDPKEKTSFGHEWIPLNPTKYRVGHDTVVQEIGGKLTKYTNCKIFSIDNWECQYNEGSGSFGCKDGHFWQNPSWQNTKIVSAWEYNFVRCKWAINDPYDGPFWGTVRCVCNWR